jgi:hypothetical protein
MNTYPNIKVREVDYGFGFVMEGDLSTLTVDNVLNHLDYQFKEIKEELKWEKEVKEALKTKSKQKDEIILFLYHTLLNAGLEMSDTFIYKKEIENILRSVND